MEGSRRRGGGAAVSKKPASAEGNAYGGLPRFVSPSAASLANYTEIFGGLASSCSIPFLDLPPAFDGRDAGLLRAGGSGFDYSEVFGSLDFGEFSSPFEEMLAVPRTEESHSGDVRTTVEATSNQLASGQFDFSIGLSGGRRLVGREGDWSSSNSNHSDNGSINVLQNSSMKQNEESKRSEKIHLKDAPVQNCGGDGDLKELSDSINNLKEQKGTRVTLSSCSSKSSENYLRAEQKHLNNKYPVSENGNAKERHHSRSSSSSKLSVDASSNDIMYVTVSDISLRTKPLRIPPPSRPPPRLSDEQGYTKPRMLSTCKSFPDEGRFFNLVSKDEDIHVHQEIVKENSSFFDPEVDASSAAAASAATREAMVLAQAKLKSAKEFMEKKHFSQNSKKLGPYEISKYKECKSAPVMMEQESFEEKAASIGKRNEITCGSKLTLHCEKEKIAVFDEEDERQGNDLQSSQPSESENKSEKWKTDKEYHELVSSEKFEMTEGTSERERLMRKKKIRAEICEIKQSENMKDALSYEIESNRTLRKDCGIPAAGVNEKNANQEAYDSNLEEVGKQREVHKLHGQGERDTSDEGDKVTSFAESGNKVKPSDNSKLHYINDNQDRNHKVEATLVTCVYESFSNLVDINERKEESKKEKVKSDADKCQDEKFEKKIKMTNIAFEPSKGEEKLNVAKTTPAQQAIEVQGARRSSISKVESIGACKCPDSESSRIEEKQCCAPNVNQIERKIEANEQEKREEIHMNELCKSIENDLPLKVDELMEQKSTVEAMACEEQLKLKVENVDCCRDCNGNETKETQLEPQQSDKNEDHTPETCNFETIVAQKMYGQDRHQCENEGIIEMQVEPCFMDKIISMNAVPVVCIRPLGMTLDVQPANLAGEVDDDMSTVVTKNSMTVSQKIISDIKKEEEYEKERMERERQTERRDKRLEEEKEKERPQVEEKEKTRLLEEKKQMKRKLKEDTERARLLEAKVKEREMEEETEQTRLVDEQGRERKSKEEKDQVMILEELKERDRKLEKDKQQAKFLQEAKEDENEAEMKHARILEETKNQERKLPEDKDEKRFSAIAKENKQKLEDGKTRLETEAAKDRERIFEQEKELTRLLDEEKERGREREKDRAAVERAIRDAHERAYAEARERAERIAAERATSEARQRASKEVQAKGDKATYEIFEKSSTEKAFREARLRAERAAVERATAEARERAVERALAEKAAADARGHAERHNAASRDRMRKNADAEEQLKSRDKLQDGPYDAQLRSTGSLSSYQSSLDSNDQREDESVLRCKARLERHQRIADRAAKALAEKNIRDILAQREQAERNRLAEHLDSDIKIWSNGKEGNLRALLSTLQYILGPENGWQPIPLTDVITASAVKKAYRKATLCVHPDKLQQRGATIQQKYICEKVFDLLKEAWNRFNSEER